MFETVCTSQQQAPAVENGSDSRLSVQASCSALQLGIRLHQLEAKCNREIPGDGAQTGAFKMLSGHTGSGKGGTGGEKKNSGPKC